MRRAVFCDIDGTLLNNNHRMLDSTRAAISEIQNKDIPFVIVTARGPSGVYPILERYKFTCPIVCYSGALILDQDRNVIYTDGFSKEIAEEIINYLECKKFDCTWNVYSKDYWIVNKRSDKRVALEESIVEAEAIEGNLHLLHDEEDVGKLLCMCNPQKTIEIEQQLKTKFPDLSIVKSSDILLEIMNKGISKGKSVEYLCEKWGIDIANAVAFGDHYNDLDMLQTVGTPFLMENAPAELKGIIKNITSSNEADGIYNGLKQVGIID